MVKYLTFIPVIFYYWQSGQSVSQVSLDHITVTNVSRIICQL